MWHVIFPEVLYGEIHDFLFSNAPHENGCYLTANVSTSKSGMNQFTVTGYIRPDKDSWNRHSEHSLEPKSEYVNKCVMQADSKGETLIFVHTHPDPRHPPSFSFIDEETNHRMFRNLSPILDNRPLGSLVLSRRGMTGVAFSDNQEHNILAVKVIGSTISDVAALQSRVSTTIDEKFDRQVRAIGGSRQRQLQRMKIAIVGVGGTGSSTAVQLARMGVRELVLIDMDNVEPSNISRLHGAGIVDVDRPKVDVVQSHLASFSGTKITTVKANITTEEGQIRALPELYDSDIIFGCTDNLASRAVLNDVAIQYYIPLIDVGCRIVLDKDGSVVQSVIKVQTVTPDHACLWCTGTLDASQIVLESYPDSEKAKLVREGYYHGVLKQPSIVSLTTMAASVGVNNLLGLLGTYGHDYPTITRLELKNSFMINESPPPKVGCICLQRRGKASQRKIH